MGPEMVQFLESQGFKLLRVRGSHHVFERGVQRTVVPRPWHTNSENRNAARHPAGCRDQPNEVRRALER